MEIKNCGPLLEASAVWRITILNNHTVDISQRINITLEKSPRFNEGPQSNPAEELQSHHCETQLHWPEKQATLGWQMVGKNKEISYCLHYLLWCTERDQEFSWGLHYRVSSAPLTFPTRLLFRRVHVSLTSAVSWVKIYLQSLNEVGCCLLNISSPEKWVNFWKKWHWAYTKFSGIDSWNHESEKKKRITENLEWYLFLWESKLMNNIQGLFSCRNKMWDDT